MSTKLKSKKRNRGARERILEKAQELFYSQGYQNTGINQIIEESGTAKASFYQYFKSKDDLAIAYLKYYEERVVNTMHRLMDKYPHTRDFFHAWCRLLIRDTKYMPVFNGCPFANFASQLEHDDKSPVKGQVQKIIQQMYRHFEVYFEKRIKAGELKGTKTPNELARTVLHIYQGGMIMAKLAHDLSYIERLEGMFLAVVHN